jgi:hypothetical protein
MIPGEERHVAPNDYKTGTGTKSEITPPFDGKGQANPQTLTAVESRQGVISGRVVTILGVSLSLALLAMVLSYLLAF